MAKCKSIIKRNEECRRDYSVRYEFLQECSPSELAKAAHHHLGTCLTENVAGMRRAVYGQLAETDRIEITFREFTVMGRLGPAMAAIERLHHGRVPEFFSVRLRAVWQSLGDVEEVRARYYALPARDRRREPRELEQSLLPHYRQLRKTILEMEQEAGRLFGLQDFYGVPGE